MTIAEREIVDINKRLKRIESILENKHSKRTWVKVSIVQELTGWDKFFLQKARENGLIKFKEEDGKFTYLLESIPEVFIKKASVRALATDSNF